MTHRLALLLSDLEESFFFVAVLEEGGAFSVVEFGSDSVVFEREEPRVVDELMFTVSSRGRRRESQGRTLKFLKTLSLELNFVTLVFACSKKKKKKKKKGKQRQ
jgi:hypothetical protein